MALSTAVTVATRFVARFEVYIMSPTATLLVIKLLPAVVSVSLFAVPAVVVPEALIAAILGMSIVSLGITVLFLLIFNLATG